MNGRLKNKKKKRKKKKITISPLCDYKTVNDLEVPLPCRRDLLRGGAASACQESLSLPSCAEESISSEFSSIGLGTGVQSLEPKEPPTGNCDTKQWRESTHGSGSHTCRSVLKKRQISRQHSRWSVRSLPWSNLARKPRPRRGHRHCVSSLFCYTTKTSLARFLFLLFLQAYWLSKLLNLLLLHIVIWCC